MGLKKIQELDSVDDHQGGLSEEEEMVEKMCEDALAAHREFMHHGSPESLERAIALYQRSSDMIPRNNPALAGILDNLGGCLRCRYQRLGDLADLEGSIAQIEAGLRLTSDEDINRPSYLCNLGNSLVARFKRLGNLADLNAAITATRKGVELTQNDDPRKAMYLSNLANSLITRFQRFGNSTDINDSVISYQAAVDLTSSDDPLKPSFLNGLGGSLMKRFQHLGNLADIDNSVKVIQVAVDLTPDEHSSKPGYLSQLGDSLRFRFRRLGRLEDIDNAIAANQAAVYLTPEDDPAKPGRLDSLGSSLSARFGRLGNLGDINDSITSTQAAVNLTPTDHPARFGYLNNLASSLQSRFERLGNRADIDDAIASSQAAVDLMPDDHVSKGGCLTTLGTCLMTRFQRFGDISDIDRSILSKQESVRFIPDGHQDKTGVIKNLGNAFKERFLRLHLPEDAESAVFHFSAATKSPGGPPTEWFDAAESWISVASLADHPSLLAAYESAINVIPLVAWLGLPIVDRHHHLIQMGAITRDAAAAAILLQQYDKALEWLEQGRSIVWTQILQLRTPTDHLRDIRPDLADRLIQVSQLLDRETGQDGFLSEDIQSLEEAGQRYRALTIQWESMIEEVRSIPSFESFLKPLDSVQLMKAARDGPVVVLNMAKTRCDALALLPELDDVIHIPLPEVTPERVNILIEELKDLLGSRGLRMRGERAAKRVEEETDEEGCKRILAELWNNLVKPVLDSLAFSVSIVRSCRFHY
jgi:tetratricopeptide (TPR) repeat protein